MPNPVLDPILNDSTTGQGRWMVVMYNNESNSFDEVIEIVMQATGCDLEEASIETWEADAFGKAPVHFANQSVCAEVASVISSIGVKTEVLPEWED